MVTPNKQETLVNASYVVNPASGEIKVVVAKQKEAETKKTSLNFVKTRHAIDGAGGGYTGL